MSWNTVAATLAGVSGAGVDGGRRCGSNGTCGRCGARTAASVGTGVHQWPTRRDGGCGDSLQGAGRGSFNFVGGPVWGAPEWLAALGHDGREVMAADICMWAAGTKVRWWYCPSPIDGCVVSASPR
jgi:hypothetical protein